MVQGVRGFGSLAPLENIYFRWSCNLSILRNPHIFGARKLPKAGTLVTDRTRIRPSESLQSCCNAACGHAAVAHAVQLKVSRSAAIGTR